MNALNQVASYDWRGFWSERLQNHGPRGPLVGVEHSGWKLIFDENRSPMQRTAEADYHLVDAAHSIGLLLKEDGEVVDTVEGFPAARAGIGPGMKVLAVNGRRFSGQVLRDALYSGKRDSQLLELLVENTDYFRTFKLDYHDGEKYPHLVRDESKPDSLSDIIRAH